MYSTICILGLLKYQLHSDDIFLQVIEDNACNLHLNSDISQLGSDMYKLMGEISLKWHLHLYNKWHIAT